MQRNSIVKAIQTLEGHDHDILCSPWQVYREALAELADTSFSCRELRFSLDIRDIAGPHIPSFEDVILEHYAKKSRTVRFIVKDFVDPMDDPRRLRRLWSAGFHKLRQCCTVHVDVYSRNDLELW